MFQHTAARRRLYKLDQCPLWHSCFNTQPPEGGCLTNLYILSLIRCFNTQPPEGGWAATKFRVRYYKFQHTAARRRLGSARSSSLKWRVSTHSRPKAAGLLVGGRVLLGSFNTQPPEGGCRHEGASTVAPPVSTHSRPKAAA